MPTYKITNPKAVQACKAYDANRDTLTELGREFASHYPNSKAVYSHSVHGCHLHGLSFTPVNRSPLWTLPQRDGGDAQYPRKAPARGVKGDERREQVAQLKVLNAQWDAHFPNASFDREPVLAALGTDWGSALLNGIIYFEHEGVVYVKTTIKPHDSWQEILGSEFDAADSARLASTKAVAA
jgi:hypothetical protein